jgi:hypothetical protein
MAIKPQENSLDFKFVTKVVRAIIGDNTPAELTTANQPGAIAYNNTIGFFHGRNATATKSIPWEDATPATEFILNATAALPADRKGLVTTANGVYVKNGSGQLVPFLAGNVIAAGSLQSIDPTNGHKVAYKANTGTVYTDYTIEAAAALPTVKSSRMVSPTGVETFEVVEGIPVYANDAARVTAGYIGIWRDPANVLYRSTLATAGAIRYITTDDIANAVDLRGIFNATPGLRPDQSGVTDIQKGDLWMIIGPGTLVGIEGSDVLTNGDFLMSLVNNPTSGADYAGIEKNIEVNMTNYAAWENQTVNLAGAPVVATYSLLTTIRDARCYDSTGRLRDSLDITITGGNTISIDGASTITNLRVYALGSI